MSYTFITGISNAGKSTLAKSVCAKTGAVHIDLDELRGEMAKDPKTKPWVNFLLDQDEKTYWSTTAPEQHIENLVKQSEAFWPFILNEIKRVQSEYQSAVFEAVNILPHLARKDLDFDGVVLLPKSELQLKERIFTRPRWGQEEELQELEAHWFFTHEGAFYKQQAEEFNYPAFSNSSQAEETLLNLMNE